MIQSTACICGGGNSQIGVTFCPVNLIIDIWDVTLRLIYLWFNKVTRAWRNLGGTAALSQVYLASSYCECMVASKPVCEQPWGSYSLRWVIANQQDGYLQSLQLSIAACSEQALAANKISMHLLTVVTESHSLFGKKHACNIYHECCSLDL